MVRKAEADPLPHTVKAEELVAGMITFYRVETGREGESEVKFKPDLLLKKRIIETGACLEGVHFEAINISRGSLSMVCFWRGAEVWVKNG
jgi:hypothetical protein